jgi:outer membrane protein assembly factor BamB
MILSAAAALLFTLPLPAQDSPSLRGPNRDGTHPSATIRTDWQAKPPTVAWTKDVGYGFAQVAVAKNRALTAGYAQDAKKSFLCCFDAETGKDLWKVEYPDTCGGFREGLIGPVATPAIDGDRFYMVAAMGALTCFDLATGQKVWEQLTNKDPGSPRFGDYGDGASPVILGDRLLAHLSTSAKSAAWHAFDKKDGKLLWSHPIEKREPASRQDKADRAYACAVPMTWQGKPHLVLVSNASVDLVDLEGGKRVFTHPIAEHQLNWGPFPDPAVFDTDKILLGLWYSGKANALALQVTAEGFKQVWANKSLGRGAYSFVLRDGCAYGYGGDGLQCVDLKSGKVQWKWRSGLDQGEVITVGDKLVWLSTSGTLYIGEAAPDKPGPIAEFKAIGKPTKDLKADKARYNATVSTSPSFAAGRLYCRSPWGDVVCVDVR